METFLEWLATTGNAVYRAFFEDEIFIQYFKGIGITLMISFLALIFAVLFSLFSNFLEKTSEKTSNKIVTSTKKVVRKIMGFVYYLIDGLPFILALFLIYTLIFMENSALNLVCAALVLGLYKSASLRKFLNEKYSKFSYFKSKIAISDGINICVQFIKESSLVGIIAVADLTFVALSTGMKNGEFLAPISIIAIMYFIVIKTIRGIGKFFRLPNKK